MSVSSRGGTGGRKWPSEEPRLKEEPVVAPVEEEEDGEQNVFFCFLSERRVVLFKRSLMM